MCKPKILKLISSGSHQVMLLCMFHSKMILQKKLERTQSQITMFHWPHWIESVVDISTEATQELKQVNISSQILHTHCLFGCITQKVDIHDEIMEYHQILVVFTIEIYFEYQTVDKILHIFHIIEPIEIGILKKLDIILNDNGIICYFLDEFYILIDNKCEREVEVMLEIKYTQFDDIQQIHLVQDDIWNDIFVKWSFQMLFGIQQKFLNITIKQKNTSEFHRRKHRLKRCFSVLQIWSLCKWSTSIVGVKYFIHTIP